jgi:hypothetical protein
MNLFLLSLLIIGLLIVIGLVVYQKIHIKNITDEKGDFLNKNENPLSIDNIYKIEKTISKNIKDELKGFAFHIIKLLISIKKYSKKILDRGIYKLAHIIFKEEILNGEIDENHVLLHIEKHKKNNPDKKSIE